MKPITLILSLLLISCSDKEGAQVTEAEHIANAYADLAILYEHYKASDTSFTGRAYATKRSEILQKYNLSQEEIDSYINDLADSPEKVKQFFDLVSKNLQERRPLPDAKKPQPPE
jgi:hypothetical protein